MWALRGALHCVACLGIVALNSRFIPNGKHTTMAVKKLSRAEIKAGLDQFPVEMLLSAGNNKTPALTTKQKEFARNLALGKTKAQAYRDSYNTKGSAVSQGNNASDRKSTRLNSSH